MSVTGDPQRDFYSAVKRICDYDGVGEFKEFECVACGEEWQAREFGKCWVCGTHLYVRDKEKIKRLPMVERPAGISDEEWRHQCEVRYWARSGITGSELCERLSKKRGPSVARKMVDDVEKYLSEL